MKHQINIYTFISRKEDLKSKKEKLQFRDIINKQIEKEINAPLENSNFEFKIHLHDSIVSSEESIEEECIRHGKYIEENDFHVVTQWPVAFHVDKDYNYFDNAIVVDSLNKLNNATVGGTHRHPNLFHTPTANTLVNTYKDDVPRLFKDKKRTELMYFDQPMNAVEKNTLDSFEKEALEKNWAFKPIFEWQENDFQNLKVALKELTEDQVILFSRPNWRDKEGKICKGSEYVSGRYNVMQVFIETECAADICGFRMTSSQVPKLFVDAKEIKNDKVYNFVGDDFIAKLPLQDRVLSLNPNMSSGVQSSIQYHIERELNNALLIGYVYKNDDYNYTSKEDFIKETRKRLKQLNGVDDSFLGFGQIIYFDEDQMAPAPKNPLIEFRGNSVGAKMNFSKNQLVRDKDGDLTLADVTYKNIDFLTIDHISIEDNTFDISFDLELTTPHSEGIEIIKFDNIVNDSLQPILLKKEKLTNGYWYFRYNITSTFSFIPRAENYPFDQQTIFVSYSLVSDKYGILEPIKNYNDDKIISDGWSILGFRSGVIRRKEDYRPIFEKGYTLVSEKHKIGIVIARPSSYTVTKVLVPLIFLAGLTLWGTFLPIEEIGTIIALVTTAFLSAIALYFSTEKPKPLSLTTTDLIFLLFYLFVGITSFSIFILTFYPEHYNQGIGYTRWGLLTFALSSIYFIYKRVQSFNGKISLYRRE